MCGTRSNRLAIKVRALAPKSSAHTLRGTYRRKSDILEEYLIVFERAARNTDSEKVKPPESHVCPVDGVNYRKVPHARRTVEPRLFGEHGEACSIEMGYDISLDVSVNCPRRPGEGAVNFLYYGGRSASRRSELIRRELNRSQARLKRCVPWFDHVLATRQPAMGSTATTSARSGSYRLG